MRLITSTLRAEEREEDMHCTRRESLVFNQDKILSCASGRVLCSFWEICNLELIEFLLTRVSFYRVPAKTVM